MRAEISFPLSPRSTAVRITLSFIVGSALWIVFSDAILHGFITDAPPVLWKLETLKGLAYVLVSGILLGIVIYSVERNQEEQRLITESKLRKLRESGLIGIFSYDGTGTIRQANPAFLRMVGYTTEELREDQVCIRELIPEEYLDRDADADREIGQRGYSNVFEEELLRKDGARVPVIGGRARIDGEKEYGIGYVLDISALKRAETEKHSLQVQLLHSEKLSSLGQLAAGVAHDFNNLLNVIIGYSTLAQSAADDPQFVRRNTDHVLHAAADATAIIGQLLAFGRKQTFHPTIVELNAVIEAQCEMLKRFVGESVSIIFQPGSASSVVADPVQLQQVLMNLVVYARDAMEGEGTITMKTSVQMIADGDPNLEAGDYAVLTVSDTGEGMDSATLARIFEPFFTTKERRGGTGLGLSTAYGIIKQNHGDIRVESLPGRGATFTILLPRVETAQADAGLAVMPDNKATVSGTILLVEDSTELREMFAIILERAGFHVLQAADGLEAIEVAKEFDERIDLILSDIAMPQMNGPDAVRQVLKERPQAKVIFMSGYSEDDPDGKGGRILEKPIAPATLIETVNRSLAA